jgi:hypothetical protein
MPVGEICMLEDGYLGIGKLMHRKEKRSHPLPTVSSAYKFSFADSIPMRRFSRIGYLFKISSEMLYAKSGAAHEVDGIQHKPWSSAGDGLILRSVCYRD